MIRNTYVFTKYTNQRIIDFAIKNKKIMQLRSISKSFVVACSLIALSVSLLGVKFFHSYADVTPTPEMVRLINTKNNGSNPFGVVTVNGVLFYSANDGINGQELWKSDGTEGGTVIVKDINIGGGSEPQNLTNVDGVLYFRADDGINGAELWKSDGTEGGYCHSKRHYNWG